MHAAAPSDDDRPEGSASPGPRVITLGCRLNLAESEAIRRLADEAGLVDAIVINSCAVTNEAVRTTRQQIRRARRENPAARLIVTGCAAQIDPGAFAQMPEVDAVIGNVDKLDAGAWAAQARGDERLRVNDIMSVRENAAHLIDGYGDRARAFLQVQNGCDHRCTFCIIPFGRGPSRSVGVAEAVASVRRLVDSGHPEIVLTGVDMTSWGHDLEGAPRLGRLVAAILDAVPDLFRLRLSSVDCAEIDDELFDRLTGDPRVAPHLHLSLQAGSNMILKRMKRRHAREDAIELTRRLRARRPEIAVGADLIAGFPTEDEAMFQDSLRLIDEAGVNYAHVFPFSARADTPAARMPQLSGEVVADRARRLREKAAAATEQFLDSLIGTVGEAVIESGGRGRFGNFAPARLGDATLRPGDVALLRVSARDGDMLIAESAGA
ncbi:MAG: tRNA (N(6)-L-threonylcarbamoyladenosine(37)-C(2))-methylthiotransferase MtaB [Alphaproteobacteria bacterium RIFCSPHIGHO2_12_FULL_63_12]|nr:MAG: tRNA (N(6)-L-threonylcarbamoyladenosine(37)-C(2))-methylthiotransferase MtaB [Alphaproteobacteria bacterium RIFCSPHIGHO2_12_FULL_63_12]